MPSRETELYKDKVEVSLDGRQIFYLFFGGAVIVGMVFVLGVLVGRRVEARGHIDRVRTHAATDPLAALDRLEGNGGLSFRGALTGKDASSDVEKTIGELEKARAAAAGAHRSGKQDRAAADKHAADKKPEPDRKPEPNKKPEPQAAKASAPEKVASKAPAAAEPPSGPVVKPEQDKPKAEARPEEPASRYTIQLSSFQDKAEAEAFLASLKAQGYDARITQAQIEGKDWFRVRMGTYRSMDAATAAKADFEKTAKKPVSIMKL